MCRTIAILSAAVACGLGWAPARCDDLRLRDVSSQPLDDTLAMSMDISVVAANRAAISDLVSQMRGTSPSELARMTSVPLPRYQYPNPSVDVMRVRMTERYRIDGLGEDSVSLSGWIAVAHGAPSPAPGEHSAAWGKAIVETQFVGLELRGQSDIFGPVEISLDAGMPSLGAVGKLELENIEQVLAAVDDVESNPAPSDSRGSSRRRETTLEELEARLRVDPPADAGAPSTPDIQRLEREIEQLKRDIQELRNRIERPQPPALDPARIKQRIRNRAVCRAPVSVSINLPDHRLEMRTSHPVVWHSLVETIPPIGESASVTLEPVRLRHEGREIGTLLEGRITFREVVKHLELTAAPSVAVRE